MFKLNLAGRIVTGLTRSTTLYKPFQGLGWLTLSERHKYQKLVLAYKTTLVYLRST